MGFEPMTSALPVHTSAMLYQLYYPFLFLEFLSRSSNILIDPCLTTCHFFSSLGARLCFEAAKYLKLYYNSQPVHLLISSATAPQVSKKNSFEAHEKHNCKFWLLCMLILTPGVTSSLMKSSSCNSFPWFVS